MKAGCRDYAESFCASVISSFSITNLSFASCPYHKIKCALQVVLGPPFQIIFIFSLCVPTVLQHTASSVQVPSFSPCLKQCRLVLWLRIQHCMSQPTQVLMCPEVIQCKITFRENLHHVHSSRQQVQAVQSAGFNCTSGKFIRNDYPKPKFQYFRNILLEYGDITPGRSHKSMEVLK